MEPLEIIIDDPKSSLIQVRDNENGEYWVRRSSVHIIDGKSYRLTERAAALAKRTAARVAARQSKRDAEFAVHRKRQKVKRDAAEEILAELQTGETI